MWRNGLTSPCQTCLSLPNKGPGTVEKPVNCCSHQASICILCNLGNWNHISTWWQMFHTVGEKGQYCLQLLLQLLWLLLTTTVIIATHCFCNNINYNSCYNSRDELNWSSWNVYYPKSRSWQPLASAREWIQIAISADFLWLTFEFPQLQLYWLIAGKRNE